MAAEGARVLPADLPMTNLAITAPVKADPTAAGVVDVPLSWQSGLSVVGRIGAASPAMLRATQHAHTISSGYISRVNQQRIAQLAVEPFYQGLIARQDQQRPVPLSAPSRRAARQNAIAMGIRWAVVWPTSGRAAVFYLLSLGFRPVSRGQGSTLMHRGRLPAASLVALRRLNT